MRIANLKSHATRMSTLKLHNNQQNSFSRGRAAAAAASAALHQMKFDAFVKAVALLAYTHDPLPSQPFAERLSRFIPMFCDSVRPVVLAMTRAKNVEMDKKVNVKASENRVLLNSTS